MNEKNLLDSWQARFINEIFNFYVDRNKTKKETFSYLDRKFIG